MGARFCHGWAATRSKIASFQDFFPHHTRCKSFLPKYRQTLSQILAYIQLLSVLPLHPNLKCFNFMQLLKSRISFPIEDSIAENKSEASLFGEAANLYQFLTMRNDTGQ